jgi:hypothetical protein
MLGGSLSSSSWVSRRQGSRNCPAWENAIVITASSSAMMRIDGALAKYQIRAMKTL